MVSERIKLRSVQHRGNQITGSKSQTGWRVFGPCISGDYRPHYIHLTAGVINTHSDEKTSWCRFRSDGFILETDTSQLLSSSIIHISCLLLSPAPGPGLQLQADLLRFRFFFYPCAWNMTLWHKACETGGSRECECLVGCTVWNLYWSSHSCDCSNQLFLIHCMFKPAPLQTCTCSSLQQLGVHTMILCICTNTHPSVTWLKHRYTV